MRTTGVGPAVAQLLDSDVVIAARKETVPKDHILAVRQIEAARAPQGWRQDFVISHVEAFAMGRMTAPAVDVSVRDNTPDLDALTIHPVDRTGQRAHAFILSRDASADDPDILGAGRLDDAANVGVAGQIHGLIVVERDGPVLVRANLMQPWPEPDHVLVVLVRSVLLRPIGEQVWHTPLIVIQSHKGPFHGPIDPEADIFVLDLFVPYAVFARQDAPTGVMLSDSIGRGHSHFRTAGDMEVAEAARAAPASVPTIIYVNGRAVRRDPVIGRQRGRATAVSHAQSPGCSPHTASTSCRLDIEALILVLLTVSRAGVPIIDSNGKSRIVANVTSLRYSTIDFWQEVLL